MSHKGCGTAKLLGIRTNGVGCTDNARSVSCSTNCKEKNKSKIAFRESVRDEDMKAEEWDEREERCRAV